MRMAIHKPGHHHPSGGVDLPGIARLGQILQPAAGAHLHQHSVANQQRPVRNDAKFVEGEPPARSFRSAHGQQLARPANENSARHYSPH